MIGVCVASNKEWEFVVNYYDEIVINDYVYGQFFYKEINNKKVIFFKCGARKVRAAGATQYMIDKYKLNEIILIGTAAGVDKKYNLLDILIPGVVVQGDCTFIEKGEGFKEEYIVNFKNDSDCIICSRDVPLINKDDVQVLLKNNVGICDMESAAIAYVCKLNNVDISIIKGITDFPGDYEVDDERQYLEYKENVPKVMEKIMNEYIEKYIS